MSSGSSFAKFFLILLNVVFMLAGAALALVGIYLLFVDNVFNIIYVDNYINTDENLIKHLCTGCIVIGSCIFVLSIVGIVGAAMENKCLLGTYIAIVLILLAANITLVVLSVRYKGKIVEKFETNVEKRLASHNYTGSLAKSMDVIQVELKCCGVNTPKNYLNSKFHKNHPKQNVPYSCCKLNNKPHKDFNITTSNVINAAGCQSEYSQLTNSKHTFKYLNNEGCFLKFENVVKRKAYTLGGIGIGIIVIEVIAIIFAFCLCNNNKRYSSVERAY